MIKMDQQRIYPYIISCLFSFLYFYFASYSGLIYDGGLYASLACSLLNGRYQFNNRPGDVPPGYPITMSLFMGILGMDGYHYASPLFAVLTLLLLYYIISKESNPHIAMISTLLLGLSPVYMEVATRTTPDTLLLFLTLLTYILNDLGGLFRTFSVIPATSAFLTKYSAAVYLLPVLYEHVRSKPNVKRCTFQLCLIIMMISPWVYWSMSNHGTPLVSHSAYLMRYIGGNIEYSLRVVLLRFYIYLPFPVFILSIVGWLSGRESTWTQRSFLLFILPVIANILWYHPTLRYLLIAHASILIAASHSINKFSRRLILCVFLLCVIFQCKSGLSLTYSHNWTFSLIEDAGIWLRTHWVGNITILAQSYRQVHFFSGKVTYYFPEEMRVDRYIKEMNVSIIIIDSYEKTTPKYVYYHFKFYPYLVEFRDRRGFVIVKAVPG